MVGSIVGSGELIMTTRFGAEAGFVLLWFVLLSCIIKTIVQAELARHTISSGRTFLQVFNDLPGPSGIRPTWLTLQWLAMAFFIAMAGLISWTNTGDGTAIRTSIVFSVMAGWILAAVFVARRKKWTSASDEFRPKINWFIWVWLACQLIAFLNGAAILGGAGQAIQLMVPGTFGADGGRIWAAVIAAGCVVLLLVGRYQMLERVSLGLVVTFTLITVICTILLQWTGYAVTWSQIASGLTFDWPMKLSTGMVLTGLGMYAATGIGTWEMIFYTYWCVEKGYARNVGERQEGDAWPKRARGWIRVMYADVLATMGIYTVTTICFFLLGAAVLHKLGKIPDGPKTLEVLQDVYIVTLQNSWAATLFAVGAFVVLFSTVFSSAAGHSRLLADGLCVLGIIDGKDFRGRMRFVRIFIVFTLAMHALIYAFIQNPPLLLILSSAVAVLHSPLSVAT